MTTPALSLAIRPDEWFLAGWRKMPPLPLPPQPPFDRDATIAQLSVLKNWGEVWLALAPTPALSEDEARFWLALLTRANTKSKPSVLLKKLAKEKLDLPALDALAEQLRQAQVGLRPEMAPLLARLLSPADFFTVYRLLWPEPPPAPVPGIKAAGLDAARGFSRSLLRWVRPYLQPNQLEDWQKTLAARISTGSMPNNAPGDWPGAYLARAFDVQPLVDRLVDGVQTYHYHQRYLYEMGDPFFLVGGVSSAMLFAQQMHRLQCQPSSPEHVRLMLAHQELQAVEILTTALKNVPSMQAGEVLVEGLDAAPFPEIALMMLELTQGSKAGPAARRWLDAHPQPTIVGVVPRATERGKLADEALEYLRRADRAGHRALIDAELAKLTSGADRIRKALDAPTTAVPEMTELPAWLTPPTKMAKLPTWLDPTLLPALTIDGKRLPIEHNAIVVDALRNSTLEKPDPLVTKLKAHAEPRSLEAFAWELFSTWNETGGVPKDKWAMLAVGLLGGDGACLKLTPLIREWPGKSQHKRAVTGLECLRAIGSEQALMALNTLAEKVKFPALKSTAQDFMAEIAKEKGLTQEQLEDRIVPDLGLDAAGRRPFDFGPRQFTAGLGPDLKPRVIDDKHDVKKDLPKPNAKDDAAKAEVAVAEWKLFKQQLKDVLKTQSGRLEKCMRSRRLWSAEEFDRFVLKHPLLGSLAQTLLWAVQPNIRTISSLFRVTEERTLAGSDGAVFQVPGDARVSIVHPMLLPADTLKAWQQVFMDYELLPPFPQLGRTLFRLESAELDQKVLTRLAGSQSPRVAMGGAFRNGNWHVVWTNRSDGQHRKYFPEVNTTAVVCYTPALEDGFGYGGYGAPDEKCEWTGCFFLAGDVTSPNVSNALPAKEVDAVVVHEVLGLMSGLAGKGK